MDQRPQRSSSTSRAYQFHPGRAAIVNLFDLYLGRSSRQKPEYSIQPLNKAQKRVIAFNRELPLQNEQFLLDFEEIQSQFADQEQLRAVTESVQISLVVQCSGHATRAEFLLFALHSLCTVGCINWDTFLPSLLSSVSTTEMSIVQGSPTIPAVSSQPGILPSSNAITNSCNFQSSNPASPIPSIHAIGSPAQSAIEPSSCGDFSTVKSSEISCTVQSTTRVNSSIRDNAGSSLRQLYCKIILTVLEFNLKQVTHAEIFSHMLNWLVNWDQSQRGIDESDGAKSCRPDKALIEWLHSCLDVVWLLVEEKCRVPFYELLCSGLQFLENIPDDEALFTIILEKHRRWDMMAMHMQMLDQHLHCPTFGAHLIFPQTTPHISGEAVASLQYSPITYPSVLGEALHGETTPSPEWWKRVLLVARCYKSPSQGPAAGAVFTSEMICEPTIDRIIELLKLTNSEINCWQEWLVFSDIFYFLIKSGFIDFVDFVNKLSFRLSEGDHHILRTNHVTWLLAQIIRVDLVLNALNQDVKTLSLLLYTMVDVFGKNSQLLAPAEPLDIADLIDFLHHVVHYEGQGGPMQPNSKPRPEVLALCGKALENLLPDTQHLLFHLKPDISSSIYASTHPKLVQNP